MSDGSFDHLKVLGTSASTQPGAYALRLGPDPIGGFKPAGLFIGYDSDQKLANLQSWDGGGKLLDPVHHTYQNIPAAPLHLSMQANGGNVGIGTTSPGAKLDVDTTAVDQPALRLTGKGAGWGTSISLNDTGTNGRKYYVSNRGGNLSFGDDQGNHLNLSPVHNVGIGTTSPSAKLDVDTAATDQAVLSLTGKGSAWGASIALNDTGTDGRKYYVSSKGGNLSFGDDQGSHLNLSPGHNVGIGTTSPAAKLEIRGKDDEHSDVLVTGRVRSNSVHGGGLYVDSEDCFVGSNLAGGIGFTTGGKWQLIVDQNSNVGIGTQNPTEKLDVVGNVRIAWAQDNALESSLTITPDTKGVHFKTIWNTPLGSQPTTIFFNSDVQIDGTLHVTTDVVLAGADCAEHFTVANSVEAEAGTVMIIDDECTLRPSAQAYDKRVAGVVSGAGDYKPGIILDRQKDVTGRFPIALVGKVFCKVDAQFGLIEPGDMLTTSPTPGHAMKAGDPARAFGAVIGKALRPLAEGQGLIPILVALQ